jgi:hypothetical protein
MRAKAPATVGDIDELENKVCAGPKFQCSCAMRMRSSGPGSLDILSRTVLRIFCVVLSRKSHS